MSCPSKKNNQFVPGNFSDAHGILMNAPIGIYTSTPEGRYQSANPDMARMLGYDSPEELLKSIADIATQVFVNSEDRQEFMRLMQKHGKVIDHECRFMRKNGSEFWVSINAHAVKDEDGLVEVYQTFIRDITDKKKAERDIKLERERFFMLLETFPGFIYLQAPDYSVRYANKYFIEQFGNPEGQLCYEVLWKRTAPCKICPTFRVFDTKKSQVWEWLQAPDGRSYAIHDYPFTDGDGTELVLEVGIDITERKMAEENIRAINEQLQKVNAEKDKLFSIIAHDLKSPISGIFSTSQILAKDAEFLSLDEIGLISTEMHKSSKNVLELLNDLMQWARMSKGGMDFSPDSCNLCELVNSSLSIARDMAGKKDIAIRSDIPEDLTVLADQSMIKTVIRNVIINAVKFSYRGGNISITASQAGPDVQVCIRDNGVGMSEKIMYTVFSVDKNKRQLGTDGEKGTGLGLVLCKEFVEQHGGRIWLHSEPGKGTKVFFTLPQYP